MIADIQRRKIAEALLKVFYKKGYIPNYKEFIEMLQKKYRFKEFGKPLFTPRGAARGMVVDPLALKSNVEEIKEDLDTAFTDLKDLLYNFNIQSNGMYGEFLQLRQRLIGLNEDLDTLLVREGNSSSEILYDNFRDTSKIDLQNTTAYVDTTYGFVTLPISLSTSVRYPYSSIQMTSENASNGYLSSGVPFLNVFSDYIDKSWQATLPENGIYQAIVNLTGKSVVQGHSNEAQINRIVVDPIATLILTIEGSVDGLNWFPLVNGRIETSTTYDFEPAWVLYLRFTIGGNTRVGIRNIQISMVGTANDALLYSKPMTSNTTIYNFNFQVDQSTPYGTTINHYIFTGNDKGWTSILPGDVVLDKARYIGYSFGASGELISDNTTDQTSLWSYSIDLNKPPIVDSGKMSRGVNQVKVEAFQFNFDSYADGNHIPDISDWSSDLGIQHQCYMSIAGENTGDQPPTEINNNHSFLMNYVNTEQDWWGICIKKTTSNVLVINNNYKITTYLYSDRDVLIQDFAGGVYARNPSNASDSPSVSNTSAWGWSMYVNSQKVASDNKYYGVAVPGSGTVLATQGKAFPVSIKAGWNKIELLVYIPSPAYIDSGFSGFNIFLLFRPNIFNFTIPVKFATTPELSTYPIWADGKPMNRVSEFYLKWNVAPWNVNYWAWRLDPASGIPTAALFNNKTISFDNSTTIDGKFTGNPPKFTLTYSYVDNPINTVYYKAEFKREPFANQPPKLHSYKFLVTR